MSPDNIGRIAKIRLRGKQAAKIRRKHGWKYAAFCRAVSKRKNLWTLNNVVQRNRAAP
jgi:hypothetical protein